MVHAPETGAPIFDTRHIPSRKDPARASLMRSLNSVQNMWLYVVKLLKNVTFARDIYKMRNKIRLAWW